MKVSKPCKMCSNIISVYKSQLNLIHFCSRECKKRYYKEICNGERHGNWKGRITKVCPTCNTHFIVATYYRNQIYCSHKCRRKRVTLLCEQCKAKYEVTEYYSKKSRFCSKECRNKYAKIHHLSPNSEFKKGHIPINKDKPGISGPAHYNWKGGISKLPYCYKFNSRIKKLIRERDNYTCQLCYTKENGKSHCVYHIHYDKDNCYPDLITLCVSCNSKVNKNRDYYENLFMNKLNYSGLLFWTKRNT